MNEQNNINKGLPDFGEDMFEMEDSFFDTEFSSVVKKQGKLTSNNMKEERINNSTKDPKLIPSSVYQSIQDTTKSKRPSDSFTTTKKLFKTNNASLLERFSVFTDDADDLGDFSLNISNDLSQIPSISKEICVSSENKTAGISGVSSHLLELFNASCSSTITKGNERTISSPIYQNNLCNVDKSVSNIHYENNIEMLNSKIFLNKMKDITDHRIANGKENYSSHTILNQNHNNKILSDSKSNNSIDKSQYKNNSSSNSTNITEQICSLPPQCTPHFTPQHQFPNKTSSAGVPQHQHHLYTSKPKYPTNHIIINQDIHQNPSRHQGKSHQNLYQYQSKHQDKAYQDSSRYQDNINQDPKTNREPYLSGGGNQPRLMTSTLRSRANVPLAEKPRFPGPAGLLPTIVSICGFGGGSGSFGGCGGGSSDGCGGGGGGIGVSFLMVALVMVVFFSGVC